MSGRAVVVDADRPAFWDKVWNSEWASRLDGFRSEVGDDGWAMWQLAVPFCTRPAEVECIKWAIELFCGRIVSPEERERQSGWEAFERERQAKQRYAPKRLESDVHPPPPPEPPPQFQVFTGAAVGGGNRGMTRHKGPLPSMDQQDRARARDLVVRNRKRTWYDDWRRMQQRAY